MEHSSGSSFNSDEDRTDMKELGDNIHLSGQSSYSAESTPPLQKRQTKQKREENVERQDKSPTPSPGVPQMGSEDERECRKGPLPQKASAPSQPSHKGLGEGNDKTTESLPLPFVKLKMRLNLSEFSQSKLSQFGEMKKLQGSSSLNIDKDETDMNELGDGLYLYG